MNFEFQIKTHIETPALMESEGVAKHLDVNKAKIRNAMVSSPSLVFVLDVEVARVALHARLKLRQGVLADAVEVQKLAVIRCVVRIAYHCAATVLCKRKILVPQVSR